MVKLETNLLLTQTQAESVLSAWVGHGVRCTDMQRMHGGMINSVLRLDFDRAPFTAVIKLSGEGKSFAREAHALEYLHQHTRFPCPRVYMEEHTTETIPYAFLLLETIPGVSLAQVALNHSDQIRIERELADVLIELHTHTRNTFGSIDGDPGKAQWAHVFVPRLYQVRAEEEVNRRLSKEVLAQVDNAISLADVVLKDQGEPTLIHGDIWAANVIVKQDKHGWHLAGLVDPGLQYADVEMELAYLQVFNTAGAAFFDAYTAYHPLRPGFEIRRLFYWLRTYLVHVWLFGDRHYREMTALVAGAISEGFA